MIEIKTRNNYNYVPDSLARQEVNDIPVIREIKTKKAKRKFKLSMVSKILVLFVLGLLVILRFAQITEVGYKINDINAEYEKLQIENNKIKEDINKKINLSEIRIEAERLNLRAPNESQKVFINTTANDRTDYWDETQEEENGILLKIASWIKNLFWFEK